MLRILTALVCLVLPLSCAERKRVLMIGNSYTAQTQNELKGFLKADKEVDYEVVVHSPGGRKLFEHLASPKVGELLGKSGEWDVVVIQEQSQMPAFAMKGGGNTLAKFEEGGQGLIKKAMQQQPKARILLFETWARHRDPDQAGTLKRFDGKPEAMQGALSKGYRHLVRNPGKWDHSSRVEVAPVGTAWQNWYKSHGYDDASRKLHSGDNSHPGKLGAYLTGAVLYEAITGSSVMANSYDGDFKGGANGQALDTELKACAHGAKAE